jgi:hypothetical protein
MLCSVDVLRWAWASNTIRGIWAVCDWKDSNVERDEVIEGRRVGVVVCKSRGKCEEEGNSLKKVRRPLCIQMRASRACALYQNKERMMADDFIAIWLKILASCSFDDLPSP